jgi:hypothetical protein
MKKFLSLFLSFCLVFSYVFQLEYKNVNAAVSGDFTYVLDGVNAKITGYSGQAVQVAIPQTIDGYTVTWIGQTAFDQNAIVQEISIPSSVTKIDGFLFQMTSSLKSINVDSLNMYYSSENGILYNKEMTSLIRVPSAFEGLKYTMPSTVNFVSSYAFYKIKNLSEVKTSPSLTTINVSVFDTATSLKTVIISEGVTEISGNAFINCINLENVFFPNTLTVIGVSSFEACIKLKDLILPYNLKTINERAFYGCSSLTKVLFNPKIQSLYNNSFTNCSSLTAAKFPSSILVINAPSFGSNTKIYGELGKVANQHATTYNLNFEALDITKDGWNPIDLKYYEKGIEATGWRTINSNTYYFDANGTFKTGSVIVGDTYYTFDNNGVLLTERDIDSISVTPPTKTTYVVNEPVNLEGGKVCLNFIDSPSLEIDLTSSMCDNLSTATVGPKLVTVTYAGNTATFSYTVIDIASIKITNPPTKTNYIEGQMFNSTGMVVKVVYTDSSEESITGYTFSTNPLTFGQNSVTISYSGKTTTQAITVVAKTLQSIAITKAPTKTSFIEATSFTVDGEITLTYDNGTTPVMNITTEMCSVVDMNAIGPQTVTVTYGGKTASYNITVVNKSLANIAITTNPTKTAYKIGEVFDPTGMVVKANYDNGSEEIIDSSAYSFSQDVIVKGQTYVTISYLGKTAQAEITIDKQLVNIAITTNPTLVFVKDSVFTANGKLTLTYDTDETEQIDMTTAMCSGYDMSNMGDQTVTVTYGGKTTTYTIKVSIAKLASDTYSIGEDYVTGVGISKTVAQVKAGFSEESLMYVSIYNAQGTLLTDTQKVGTGCVVKLIVDESVIEEVTVVITGDVKGDGEINSDDILLILNMMLKGVDLTDEYLMAANTKNDTDINSDDILLILNFMLKGIPFPVQK